MNIFLTFTVASLEVVQNSFPSWVKLTSSTSSECSSNVSLRCVGVSCVKRWYSFCHEVFPGGKDPWQKFKMCLLRFNCFTFPKIVLFQNVLSYKFKKIKHNSYFKIKILCGHLINKQTLMSVACIPLIFHNLWTSCFQITSSVAMRCHSRHVKNTACRSEASR